MKVKYVVILIILFVNAAFSKEVGTIKISKKSIKSKVVSKNKNPFINAPTICKQKSIPMKVEQSLNASLLTVSFTAEQKIENFSLENARGVDGVTVTRFQELLNQKLEAGEVIEATVELGEVKGLVYVVFDVSLTINGVTKVQSIPIAVGALSTTQKNERSKNIKEIKNNSQQKEGTDSITIPAKKIHEMKLE